MDSGVTGTYTSSSLRPPGPATTNELVSGGQIQEVIVRFDGLGTQATPEVFFSQNK